MNFIVRNIPNSITCLNLTAGMLSILSALNGDSSFWGMTGYEWSWIFIGIAAVMDFMDGFAARLLHAYSNLGKELDSLCDLVSFGVAPAFLTYITISDTGEADWMKWFVLLIPVCGALRLARFNIDTRQTTEFIGLPIPANAIFWIGYTSICYSGSALLSSAACFIPVVIIESWLMISNLRLFSLKFKTWGLKGNEYRWLLIVTAIVCVAMLGVSGFMWLIVAYVLYGIIKSCF